MRVLVVDDEPSDAISMTLRHQGYVVETADNGKDALERARRWRPHAMVLDVMLPEIDGFEAARQLWAERAGVPILFLSAAGTTGDRHEPMKGFAQVIARPGTRHTCRAAMRSQMVLRLRRLCS
jgi:DNA-binding response OmpR family regulator